MPLLAILMTLVVQDEHVGSRALVVFSELQFVQNQVALLELLHEMHYRFEWMIPLNVLQIEYLLALAKVENPDQLQTNLLAYCSKRSNITGDMKRSGNIEYMAKSGFHGTRLHSTVGILKYEETRPIAKVRTLSPFS